MSDLTCPYCDHDEDACYDDGYGLQEDQTFERECDNCGKTFVYTTQIWYTHTERRAPCLNGEEHDWIPVVHTPPHWPNWKRCRWCDKEERGEMVKL